MESTVWSTLPGDLQIRVFLWLPPLDLRRFSFTCKYFHSLLSDKSFAIHYDRHRLAQTVFVASFPRHNRMYKMVLKSLIRQEVRNPMLPWQIPLFCYFQGSRWCLYVYGDGFVCYRGPINDKSLLVFNPLFPHESRSLSLPAAFDYVHFLYRAIAFDRKIGACKLICWWRLPESRIITGIYNFKEGTWKTTTACNGCGNSIERCAQLVNERFLCWLCTDFISSVNKVLVFDVEEEMWKEPIPLGDGSFICVIQHEKQLCLIKRTYEKKETIFELWKFDLQRRVLRLQEFIPMPITGESEYLFRVAEWSPGFLSVQGCKLKGKSCCTWVYDISHHSWQYMGDLGIAYNCFEGSMFRLAV